MTEYAKPPIWVTPAGGPGDDEIAEWDAYEKSQRQATEHERLVERELERLRAREEAQRRFAAEQRARVARPPLVRLDEFLARPLDAPTYRIDKVWPTGGRIMLEAQFKAGKTTTIGNTIRSLVDGDDLFGRFAVRPGARVVLIDDELDDRNLQSWLTDQGIRNQAAVRLVALRGLLETFDIRDPDVRTEWARDINGADVVILDCLRPILDALGLDENHEAGKFLVPFDALLLEAGASEAIVVHHMGHGAERARGDSRLKDWPDASWKLVRDKDEDNPEVDEVDGSRYFSAFGRDVNVPQAELTYDPATRHQTLSEHAANRRQATEHRKELRAREAVLEAIRAQPGINASNLRLAVNKFGIKHNPQTDAAVGALVAEGLIWRTKIGRTTQHFLAGAPSAAMLPTLPNDAQGDVGAYLPTAPIGQGQISTPPGGDDPAQSGDQS
ncbi:MAG TPA: AAA family ATPase [Nocardioides sp.]|uniref:AAA family ATPase n=1 Tax=Nocardioides sp. TaxID=35761 RepID=UPI002CAA9798|nr:AAA family ATPase [Nocardioides sp.]HTW15143.1 AAA family ATPase [Nocardioides sp.]